MAIGLSMEVGSCDVQPSLTHKGTQPQPVPGSSSRTTSTHRHVGAQLLGHCVVQGQAQALEQAAQVVHPASQDGSTHRLSTYEARMARERKPAGRQARARQASRRKPAMQSREPRRTAATPPGTLQAQAAQAHLTVPPPEPSR